MRSEHICFLGENGKEFMIKLPKVDADGLDDGGSGERTSGKQ